MKFESGIIFVDNIRIHARHGVMEQERLTGADFVVSLRVRYPIERSFNSDDVADTVNYALLNEIVEQEMAIPSQLLEHVASRIGKRIVETYPDTEELTVSVKKDNPPMGADCDGAGVQLHWICD